MVRGQTVAQPHCQFQRLLIVYCFERSTHAHQYTITGQRYLLLSDKLLATNQRYTKSRNQAPSRYLLYCLDEQCLFLSACSSNLLCKRLDLFTAKMVAHPLDDLVSSE